MTVVSIVLGLAALAVAVLALRRADVVERRAKQWMADHPGAGTATASPAQAETDSGAGSTAPSGTGGDAAAVVELRRRVAHLEGVGSTAGLSRVAVVRFDAFEELGGRLSFSAAIVDDTGHGLVLTAIHGRSETRSYLKQVPVTEASGQRELSPEETQAVSEAMRRGA